MSAKRRKSEIVEPDFSLFEHPQKGYSAFEGLDLAAVTKTMQSPESRPQPENLIADPPPTIESILPLDSTPPPSPTPQPSTKQKPPRKSAIKKKRLPENAFAFKTDWDLLLTEQQFKILDYLLSFQSTEVWIQVSTIERATKVPLPTIRRAFAVFGAKKLIKTIKSKVSGGDRHSIITLNLSSCKKFLTANYIKYRKTE